MSSNLITMKDWLAMKPYATPIIKYDDFYVLQCQKVHQVLNEQSAWLQKYGVSRDQMKELTCQLVSYFEDYINKIGIWRSYIDYNKELYGYFLPFYDLSEYDETYINVEDSAFLMWHYLVKYTEEQYIINPNHDNIMLLSVKVIAHFKSVIEQAPSINFYKNFFTIKENSDFFLLKSKMKWFSTESYLLGVELGEKLRVYQAAIKFEAFKKRTPINHISAILYSAVEEYLFQKRSSYSALNGPEWFARIATCSETQKQDIIETNYWIDGKFYLKEKQGEYLIFEHILTNITYKALADSFQNNKGFKVSDTTAYNMHLIRWNGVYVLSGMVYTETMTTDSLKKYKLDYLKTPWILPEEALNSTKETTQLMYESFVEYFGSPLALFDSTQEAEKANNGYMDFYSSKLKGERTDTFEERNKKFKEKTGRVDDKLSSISKHIKKDNGVAMFFMKDVGMQYNENAKKTIELLKAPTLSQNESVDLFVDFTNGYIQPFCEYLLSQYGGKNLKFPTKDNDVDVVKHLPFFWRMNSPEEFDRVYPLMTMVDSSLME